MFQVLSVKLKREAVSQQPWGINFEKRVRTKETLVNYVQPSSLAESAGLKVGDRLLAVDGQLLVNEVNVMGLLNWIVHEALDCQILIERLPQQSREIQILSKKTVVSRSESGRSRSGSASSIGSSGSLKEKEKKRKRFDIASTLEIHLARRHMRDAWGFAISTLAPVVIAVTSGSPAEVCGIRRGDQILRVNQMDVKPSSKFFEVHFQLCNVRMANVLVLRSSALAADDLL